MRTGGCLLIRQGQNIFRDSNLKLWLSGRAINCSSLASLPALAVFQFSTSVGVASHRAVAAHRLAQMAAEERKTLDLDFTNWVGELNVNILAAAFNSWEQCQAAGHGGASKAKAVPHALLFPNTAASRPK